MVNQSSIKYISSLLSNPETITSGDQSSIALFRQTFPFFVPVRYLAAVEKNKQSPYNNEMLAEIQPYLGDWMLFCDFLEAGARAKDKVLDKKKVDVSPLPTSPATSSASTMPTSSSVEPPIAKQEAPAVVTLQAKEEPAVAKKEEPQEPIQDKPFFKIDTPLPTIEILGVDAVTFREEPEETLATEAAQAAEPVAAATSEPAPVEQTTAAPPQAVATPEVIAEMKPELIAVEQPGPPPVEESAVAATAEVPAELVAEMPAPEVIQQIAEEAPAPVAATPENPEAEQPQITESVVAEEAEEVSEAAIAETIAPQPVAVEEANVVEVTFDEHEEVHEEPAAKAQAEVFAQAIPTLDVAESKDPLISPVYTQDYFLQQGEKISEEIPDELGDLVEHEEDNDEDKSLMVMMSFSEWLLHFKNTSEKQQEEKKDQKALKTMWQKEKLAAAMEEENEEIPENVFQMAVNSITKEEDLASEPLANIYIKQGRYDQAIEMYRKLSLRNPQKSTYFARKIEEIQKEKS